MFSPATSIVARRSTAVRCFQGAAAFKSNDSMQKLKDILEDYVRSNFNQGLPSSFLTPIISEVHEPDDGFIQADAAARALQKLRSRDNVCLTRDEAWDILGRQLGARDGADKIAQDKFNRLFFENVSRKSPFGLP